MAVIAVAIIAGAQPASAQSVKDRLRDGCVDVATEQVCDDAIGLLWPILVTLSLEPGDPLLSQAGIGTMSTTSFLVTTPDVRVDWTVDATDAPLGCTFMLKLLPVSTPPRDAFYDPPWGTFGDLLSASVDAGQTETGVGYAHGVDLDYYFLRQDGLGGCTWTVKVTSA